MSLGLPGHLAREANSRALAGATRIGGLVALAAAAASVLIPSVATRDGRSTPPTSEAPPFFRALAPDFVPVIGLIAVVLLAIMFVVLTRHRSIALMVATLVVGAGTAFIYTFAILIQNPVYADTGLFVIALPVIALTLIGGTGSGSLVGMIWASCGYAAGETAEFLAAGIADREFTLGTPALYAYLVVIAVVAMDGLTRNLKRGAQSNILRAMRIEQTTAVQQSIAADVASELHDTTLSQLAVLAQTRPGPLTPELRQRIERGLESWGRDRAEELEQDARRADTILELWQQSGLASAVEQARDEGLVVEVSGDRGVLARVTGDQRHALALAVRQCLANVLRHSGQFSAELALSSCAGEVSVMVVDGGRGFDVTQAGRDRMGLQYSVRDRIERVGGRVAIFSRPGAGTTIAIVLPATSSASLSDGVVP
jgi:signal transduction histidine kinase